MSWKKLSQESGDFPRSWDWETDKELDGVYLSSRDAKSKKGKPITFHQFKVGEEEVSVLGGVVLDRQLGEIEENARVLITYLGEKEGKNGTYKNYEVSVWE